MVNAQEFKKNDKWTKLMFGVLIFFGIATLFLGILKINRSINENIFPKIEQQPITKTNNQQKTPEELMTIDTDGDGLSDYQEMYVYGTSIYLADTDSDGYSDKDEVDNGYDPNCPKGSDCLGSNDKVINNKYDNQENTIDYSQFTEPSINKTQSHLTEDQKKQFNNLSATDLRQLLLESGEIKKEDLDRISDDDLMAIFKDIINQ